MKEVYSYRKSSDQTQDELLELKNVWLNSLTSPPDGMWQSIRDTAIHWEIRNTNELIGYTCVNDDNQLLQFYIIPQYLSKGADIFKEFLAWSGIKKGIVGTNNPIYLTHALNAMEHVEIHTYLFRDGFEVSNPAKAGVLKLCEAADLDRIVEFCQYSIKAPVDWLKYYVSLRIERGEIFVLEENQIIIGTCEVRRSGTHSKFVDIGMIVSPDFRRKGYGTYLLSRAKQIAKEWEKECICSCEKNNIGSYKSISNCGFVSKFQLLVVNFNCD